MASECVLRRDSGIDSRTLEGWSNTPSESGLEPFLVASADFPPRYALSERESEEHCYTIHKSHNAQC